MLDTSRIASVIDVLRMQESHLILVGAGGSCTLASDLVRCGLGRITLIDFDRVEASNVARQEHMPDRIGLHKVEALAAHLKRINADLIVATHACDVCALSDAAMDGICGDANLIIAATDSHRAQARVNELALRRALPALFIGVYEAGRAGEVVFWHPEILACYRCLMAKRYEAHANGRAGDPPSQGATVLDVHVVDSIAGMLAVGLLTRGADNRFGRLIDQLGDRNFLQAKIDPLWTFGGRDVIREQLGIPDDRDTYFSFCTVARRDPDGGMPPCPDCVRFRKRTFIEKLPPGSV